MKPLKKNTTKKVASKSVRLKWTPLNQVQPVELTPQLTKGNVVYLSKHQPDKRLLLVP